VTVQFTWDSLGRKKTEIPGPNPPLLLREDDLDDLRRRGECDPHRIPGRLLHAGADLRRREPPEAGRELGGTDIVAVHWSGAGRRVFAKAMGTRSAVVMGLLLLARGKRCRPVRGLSAIVRARGKAAIGL
jgi:hypothetical protein